jgi:hypothetical protein
MIFSSFSFSRSRIGLGPGSGGGADAPTKRAREGQQQPQSIDDFRQDITLHLLLLTFDLIRVIVTYLLTLIHTSL